MACARRLTDRETGTVLAPRTARLVLSPERATRAEQADISAASLYESGYWCGEAVLKTVNDLVAEPFPGDVSRLASGFCEGLGGSRCTCGALAGSVMAAGLLAGRTGPQDAWEPVYDIAGELRRRFVADQDADSCDAIVTRIGDMGDPERWAHCTLLVGKCARWVVEIAEERGLL